MSKQKTALLIPGSGRGKRAGCVYGYSRRLKSVSMAALARWIYEKSGLRSRLVAIEGEGVEMFDDLIAADVVSAVFVPRNHERLLEALDKLSKGWWPADPKVADWPLIAPSKPDVPTDNHPEELGGFFWETFSATAQTIMSAITSRPEMGAVPGRAKDPSGEGDRKIKSGEAEYAFAGMKDFGFCQQRTRELIVAMAQLPMPIKFGESLESAREAGNEKEGTYRRLPVVGPDIIGNAVTEDALAWLGPLIHLTGREVQAQIADPIDPKEKLQVTVYKYVMYTRTHIEPGDRLRVPCFADLRLSNKAVLDKIPYAAETDLAGLYELIDSLLVKQQEAQQPQTVEAAVA